MPSEKRQRKREGRQARLEAARAEATRRRFRRRVLAVLGAAAVVVGVIVVTSVFGDDDEAEVATGTTTTTTTAVPAVHRACTAPAQGDKPAVEVPGDPAPTTLQSTDLTVGTGAEAAVGDEIEVHYVGVLYADCTQFDSSWDRGATATFPLAEGSLIDGWVQGIPGMKVGGRRMLVIPPELAYGAVEQRDIPANSTLVFVIDLVSIT